MIEINYSSNSYLKLQIKMSCSCALIESFDNIGCSVHYFAEGFVKVETAVKPCSVCPCCLLIGCYQSELPFLNSWLCNLGI